MLVSEVLFDRTALLAAGGYRDDLNYYEDSDLCQRLRECGYDLWYEPAAVGVHQRSDDLIGLLTLRWKYSEYRQRHLLDRFAGLLEKCSVNREYALNTLSRSLARGREALAYISCLLFFHHLLMDLRSLLSRRPLVSAAAKSSLERQLADRALQAAANTDGCMARRLAGDLAAISPPSPPAADTHIPPAWPAHLDAVQAAVQRFCTELPAQVRSVVEASARYCRGELTARDVPRLGVPAADALEAELARLPQPARIDAEMLNAIRGLWPETRALRPIGPILESERAMIEADGLAVDAPAGRIAIVPRAEARARPLEIFREAGAEVRHLVIVYQPPGQFIAGLDAATPADLASTAAEAGWTIERFETLVGKTRLMLSR
jgi:hypothetical protein